MKKVLVTGSNGFVASRLTQLLKEQGIWVRGFDIAPKHPNSVVDEFVRGDLSKIEDVVKACTGIDTVFHVASIVFGPPELVRRVNMGGTQNIIETCCKCGVLRLVYTSTCSVVFGGKDIEGVTEDEISYAENLDFYNFTKRESEIAVLKANGRENGTQQGLLTVALRPHTIYGPGDSVFFPKVLKTAQEGKLKFRVYPDKIYSSYTFVDNVCIAEILAAQRLRDKNSRPAGQAYFINDGEKKLFYTRLYEIGALAVPRSSIGRYPLPIPFFVLFAISWIFWKSNLKVLGELEPMQLKLASTHHYYSTKKAKEDLGYAPVMDPEKSWQLTLDSFKNWAKENPPPKKRNSSFVIIAVLIIALILWLLYK